MRVGGENLWLERVNFATEPPSDSDARRERSSALDELIQSARESLQSEETLEAIEAALAPLARKLPREWRDDSSALQFHDRETVRAIAGLALDHWTARLAADREAAR